MDISSLVFRNTYSFISKSDFLKEYYTKIKNKYSNNTKINSLSVDEFINLFGKPNIYYVAGFMRNLSKNTNSNYAKYLIIDTYKKLHEKGYEFLLLDLK